MPCHISLPNSNSINGTLRADRELMRKYLNKETSSGKSTEKDIAAQDLQKILNSQSKQQVAMEELSRMKVVLDSGALVGHLAPAMDEEMGTRQILAGRGVI